MLLSRVADSVYWLNRYIERADNIARFIGVNLDFMLELPAGLQQQWKPLIITTGDSALFQERYGEATQENVLQFLTFDRDYSHSILSVLRFARENARSIREVISSEMWEEVNSFYHMVEEAAQQEAANLSPEFFNGIKFASHRFAGVMDATMTHNEGWHFGRLGRHLERADKTTRIIDVKYFVLLPSADWVGTPLDQIQWMALLKSASAYEMYRKQQHRITPAGVAEFLILDRAFPRSIHFCLGQVEYSLHQITGTPPGTWCNPAERALGRLCAQLGYLTIDDIVEGGLHQFLDEMQGAFNDVGTKISDTFFRVTYASSP